MTPLTPPLLARLAALILVGVIVQTAMISQLPIAGANADLAPLLVMAVGLLCGSLAGGAFGFGVGLFVDDVLLQQLGVSSLVLLTVGYGAGRIREARDPEGTFVPLAVGAAATLVFSVGFSIMQFLLGVDAPVSWALVRDILTTLVINTLIALPVYAIVRRWLLPSLPDDPRRRRRRAYTTGGLSPLSRSAGGASK
jgi:rod shape-determining protein MreD